MHSIQRFGHQVRGLFGARHLIPLIRVSCSLLLLLLLTKIIAITFVIVMPAVPLYSIYIRGQNIIIAQLRGYNKKNIQRIVCVWPRRTIAMATPASTRHAGRWEKKRKEIWNKLRYGLDNATRCKWNNARDTVFNQI